MVSSKVTGLMALALQVTVFSAQAQGDVCLTPPTRCMPVHGSPTWSDVCADQKTNCAALCGGSAKENTCTSDAEDGNYSPFLSITYCYGCTCADGSTPDLLPYLNTVPNVDCQRQAQNCFYMYDQYAQSPPDGACPACGEEYAPGQEPTWDIPVSTTTTGVEPTTTSAPETTITSGIWYSGTGTSTSSLESSTTPAPESTITSDIRYTGFGTSTSSYTPTANGTITSSSSRTSSTMTTTTPAVSPVPTSGAGLVEPVMGVLGMAMAALMAL